RAAVEPAAAEGPTADETIEAPADETIEAPAEEAVEAPADETIEAPAEEAVAEQDVAGSEGEAK
ncbi:MAG: 50S ribosomal protein L17, partial [Mycobacterium sp.]